MEIERRLGDRLHTIILLGGTVVGRHNLLVSDLALAWTSTTRGRPMPTFVADGKGWVGTDDSGDVVCRFSLIPPRRGRPHT